MFVALTLPMPLSADNGATRTRDRRRWPASTAQRATPRRTSRPTYFRCLSVSPSMISMTGGVLFGGTIRRSGRQATHEKGIEACASSGWHGTGPGLAAPRVLRRASFVPSRPKPRHAPQVGLHDNSGIQSGGSSTGKGTHFPVTGHFDVVRLLENQHAPRVCTTTFTQNSKFP